MSTFGWVFFAVHRFSSSHLVVFDSVWAVTIQDITINVHLVTDSIFNDIF